MRTASASMAGSRCGTYMDWSRRSAPYPHPHPIDPTRSAELLGSALGVAFLGFAGAIAIGSARLDILGMGRLLALAGLCFIAGGIGIETTPHPVSAGDQTGSRHEQVALTATDGGRRLEATVGREWGPCLAWEVVRGGGSPAPVAIWVGQISPARSN